MHNHYIKTLIKTCHLKRDLIVLEIQQFQVQDADSDNKNYPIHFDTDYAQKTIITIITIITTITIIITIFCYHSINSKFLIISVSV